MEQSQLFVRLPLQALKDQRLTRSALVLYAVMIDAANKWLVLEGITIRELASRSGLSEKTVRRSERQLVDLGYIYIRRTGRASVIDVMHNLTPMRKSTYETYEALKEDAV